jgi:hypothetical protein
LTERRNRAFSDSIALVVQMIDLISLSKARNGTNSGPGVLPEPDDRRVAGLPGAAELGERVQRGGLGHGGVDRLEVLGDGSPVPLADVAEAVAQQVRLMPTSA